MKQIIILVMLCVAVPLVGAGIKFATGHYNVVDKSYTSENANLFQMGTGSADFTLGGMYEVGGRDFGVNLSAAYKVNTFNSYDYCYGNKVSLNARSYYKFRIKGKTIIAPNAGFLYESAAKDVDHGFAMDISGGRIFMGIAGIGTTFKHFSVGANYQVPLVQNLANGIVRANNRAMVHVSILL